MSVSRRILTTLEEIIDDGAYANLALKKNLAGIDKRDRKLISATVFCLLEHIMYIDYIINFYANGKQNKHIRNIMRIGVTRLFYMNTPVNAVCDESVKLTREIGKSPLSGYVNGVMRSICRAYELGNLVELPTDLRERMSIETCSPLWLVNEYCERFGENRANAILSAKDSGLCIRSQYPYTSDELKEYLHENNIEYVQGKLVNDVFHLSHGFNVVENSLFADGKITVQSESSSLVCKVCNPFDGADILDACAAPGGKSAYLSSLMKGHGTITAWDIHEHRTELIKNTLKRLKVKNVSASTHDATESKNELQRRFDIVLTDVPCSGLGVIGKADIRFRKTEQDCIDLSSIQHKILSVCSAYVKVGGTLVYSTCTVTKRENEEVVERFLHGNDSFVPFFDDLEPTLRERFLNGCLTLLPDADGTDGFFIARMKRIK